MANILKRIYNWIKKKDMPPEDLQRVERYRLWLNSLTPGQNWVALAGWNAITTVSAGQGGQLVYNPQVGRPVKAFLNQTTGEVRMFDSQFFYRQNNA